MSKKRVLVLCASKGEHLGGMESQVQNLLASLSKNSDIKIALAGSDLLCAQTPKKQACFQLPFHLNRRNPILLFQLYDVIRRFKPDIVHCHGQKAAQLVSKLCFLYPNCIRIATVHGDKRSHNELRNFHATVTVSKYLHEKLLNENIRNQLIENGIATYQGKTHSKQDVCERFGLNSNLPLFIAAARLAPVKNFEMLICAFDGLQANLIIFGDGPERKSLQKLARNNTILAGHHKNVLSMYQAADALLVSSHREGLSLSMIEALRQNTLVLSSPVSGAVDILPKNCLLDISSPKTLHDDLKQKSGKLSKLRKDSAEAFSYAKKQLSLDRMSRETYQLYKALLQEQRGKRGLANRD